MQGKEREATFGLNRINLGARTYNPTIGRMDGVDALSDKFHSFSPYNANFNNPLRFFDPDGNEATDDYKLKANGQISLLKKTNDNFDKLTADNGKSITVTKKNAESTTIISQLSKEDKDGFSVGKTSSLSYAKKVFDFANQNTTPDIEFSLAGYSKNGNNEYSVATSHQISKTSYSKLNIKPTDLIFHIHNHDGGSESSGFDDIIVRKISNEVSKNTYYYPRFFILQPDNRLEEYDTRNTKGLPKLNYSIGTLKSLKKYNYHERVN
jgi:RHS repeat-associated protein